MRLISQGCVWTNFFGVREGLEVEKFQRGEGVEPALPAGRRGDVFGPSLMV